ncbi:MAG TPA: hypothetical protein VKN73_07540 [Desulfosalsimonadaceae bacterium]|nr:hypothetical protein [Desulfosalsimonadaceae bacterium]
MEEQHIKEIPLKNNLRLHIYDASRRLAGDRWLVKMIARIPISVDDALSDAEAGLPAKSAVKELIGENIVFEQEKIRNFIDEGEKNDVFQALLNNFLDHLLTYLSHPAFAKRYTLKTFQEKEKQKAWQSGA